MTAIRIAALFGFLAVILGALGAHGPVREALVANSRVDEWKTASLYHLVHAAVLLVIAVQLAGTGAGGTSSPVFWLWSAGIVLFSGSLYLLCLTPMKWLGPVTPIGGLFLLAGWLYLAVRGLR